MKKRENAMIRFFLFVGIAWLVSKLAALIFRSMTRSSRKESARQKYGSTQASEQPQMEFKDVQDAKFEDIPEKDRVPK